MRDCVTGAAGFIGKRWVKGLRVRRGGTLRLPVGPGSDHERAELRRCCGVDFCARCPSAAT